MNHKTINIAILGGSGQLGNYLSSYLCNYFNVTSFSSSNFPFPNANIENTLSKYSIIINCVGFPYRFSTIDNINSMKKSKKLNYDFVINIADYCRRTNKKIVHISTNAVYSSNYIHLHKENELSNNAVIAYDKHKLLADLYIEKYSSNYLIIRPYSLHGDPIIGKNFYNILTSIIDNAKDEIIIVDGITAQFVSGKLIANAIIHLLDKKLNGVYNLSTPWIYRTKLLECFLKMINEKKGINIKKVNKEYFNITEIKHGLMNCNKIINTGFNIPSTYLDMKDWWTTQLSFENKKIIIQSIQNIKNKYKNKYGSSK